MLKGMSALKAHVVNGRIVVDDPVDLPEGTELAVFLYDAEGDELDDEHARNPELGPPPPPPLLTPGGFARRSLRRRRAGSPRTSYGWQANLRSRLPTTA